LDLEEERCLERRKKKEKERQEKQTRNLTEGQRPLAESAIKQF
jgi:hypothetical protein